MATSNSVNGLRLLTLDLERLVEVWKSLGNSDVNVESITNLITQKLVGLDALGENDLQGTTLKDLGHLVDVRNTIVELNVCSTPNHAKHWQILDAFLEHMIANRSLVPSLDPEYKSDIDCLETLEEWAALASKMTEYPLASPKSSTQLDYIIAMELNELWEAFRKGSVVIDDVSSMKALEIAAKIRDTLHPHFHMWIDKIIAQKLRFLSIPQAGKLDPSLNRIVQGVPKRSALSQEQDNSHHDFNKNDNPEAALCNAGLGNFELKQENFSTIALVHDLNAEPSHHPQSRLDSHTLDADNASLLPPATTGKHKHTRAKEDSDRSIQELEAENRDLILHIKTFDEAFRKQKATSQAREASSRLELRDLKADNAKMKGELQQMAVKADELEEDKKQCIQQLVEAMTMIDRTKQWLSGCPHEGVVKAKERKTDQDGTVSDVPRSSTYERNRSTGAVNSALPKRLEDDSKGTLSFDRGWTPASGNSSWGFWSCKAAGSSLVSD